MPFIDAMIAAVPKDARDAFAETSRKLSDLLKGHGALAVHSNWGVLLDESPGHMLASRAGCGPDETVVTAWVVWPSREARDKGWEVADPEYQALMDASPVDERMYVAGFEPLGDS
jgi:uncharacterized protein YbaA (DUF1428 family)